MALTKYVLTATVVLPAGTAATVVAGEPGTGGAAGFGGAPTTGGQVFPTTLVKGMAIVLDAAGAVRGDRRRQPAGVRGWSGQRRSRRGEQLAMSDRRDRQLDALALVQGVGDGDGEAVRAVLDYADLRAVCVELAGMLSAWLQQDFGPDDAQEALAIMRAAAETCP